MRVAIVHDYIKEYGGAERVLESLHNIFPNAPIYTSVYLPSYLGPHRKRFENWNIKTSWAQNLPFKAKLISPMRVISPLLFKSFDFSKFDVIISSATGAFLPNSLNKKGAILICYCHTPPKHLYGYETARDWRRSKIERIIGEVAIHFLRLWDFGYSKNVDFYIANSEEIKKRIEKFYRKDAVVIYPPVSMGDGRGSKIDGRTSKIEDGRSIYPQSSTLKNLSSTFHDLSSREYYLAGGRIARAKHPDLILEVFEKNKLPLKIFGRGFAGFEEEIRQRFGKTKNIEFLGEISDEEKFEYMRGAKAFIFASKDEDFGITPVEAMMMGTPVIAHRSGGVLETVIEGKTGLFFDEFTIESLNAAIKRFERTKFDSAKIKQHAQKFGKARFEDEIRDFVKSKIKN